jgi:predicted RNase H-like HicB family nuclease
MKKYEIIVYWSSEDGSYIAEVPELAGCIADGQSYVEAIQNHFDNKSPLIYNR